jgi:HAD superfamily hydrolase (TIGR01450 family)
LDYQAYLFDLDGTIYLGADLLPGAAEAIASLRAAGRAVMYLSNKPIATRASYAAKLTALGIPTEESDVLNSSQALAHWMARETPGARAYAIAEAPVLDDLAAAGIRVVDDPLAAEVVVASWDRGFSYDKLNSALQALNAGARLVATNPDVSCPVDGGLFVPDCGAITAAIEACSGRTVELYGGKPSPIMGELALARLDVAAEDCLMVGDRVHTDILFGHNAGMGSALVLTGAGRLVPLEEAPARPDYVLESVADLHL